MIRTSQLTGRALPLKRRPTGHIQRIDLARLALGVLALHACSPSTEPAAVALPLRLEPMTATTLAGTVGREVAPTPVVQAVRQDGTPVAGIAIGFAARDGGFPASTSVRTDAGGIATVGKWILGPGSGPQTLTANLAGRIVVFTALAAPGPVFQITRLRGNNQDAFAGAPLEHPLEVRVVDLYDNPVSSAPVSFTVISGNGTIAGGSAVTDAAGIAVSGQWTLGPEPGVQQVSARSENGTQTVFTAIACEPSCLPPQFAFVRSGRIVVTDISGGGGVLELTDGGRDDRPAWAPDGSRIAFVRRGPDLWDDLYLMDADGSDAVRILAATIYNYGAPAWSPDGRTLAVHYGDCTYDCAIGLLDLDLNGTAPVRIASQAAWPAWSPDGKKIAFVSLSGDDGYHALHLMNSDGSDVTELTLRDPGGIQHPTWSPDGRRIAFSKCSHGGCDIYVVSATASPGTAVERLTTVGDALSPAWSPDGIWIAFTRFRTGPSVAYVPGVGGEPIHFMQGSAPAWRP